VELRRTSTERWRAGTSARARWKLTFGALLLTFCGTGEAPPEAVLVPPVSLAGEVSAPGATCSELTRAVAEWQGREFEVCGRTRLRYETLTALGDGYLMGWEPGSGKSELWRLGADDTFGIEPLATWAAPGSFRDNRLLAGFGGRLLDYHQKTGELSVHAVNFDARGLASLLPELLGVQSLVPIPLGGRAVLALDDRHVLLWQQGSGSYAILRYQVEGEPPFERFSELGVKPTFRRGHRWFALGENRLASWSPRTHAYEIWSYALDRLPGDIFASQPLASGEWPDLGYEHELFVVAPGKLGIWNRDAGTLELRALDPLSSNPLSGEVLNTTQDDRFVSLRPGSEKSTTSAIRRLVIVFQQGRSFDAYFGRYCRAAPGTNPACTDGPECCEAMPQLLEGVECHELLPDDDGYVPQEAAECLTQKFEAWRDDRLVVSSACGNAHDFACALPGSDSPVTLYHELASAGALADRYFASVADTALPNFIYFGLTQFGNEIRAQSAVAVTSLLAEQNIPFVIYVSGSDSIFEQSPPYHDDGSWAHFRAIDELAYDIENEELGPISVVIPDANTPQCEAPGEPASLRTGIEFTASVARQIRESARYQPETLLLITHLAGGGYYDHVAPPSPAPANVDASGNPYGARVPFLALGPFARKNHVSHSLLEHCSLTAFIEWNWLDGRTGQLGGRDGYVANIGSLLDPATTGVPVPSDP
jgi:hypothetical protein